MDTSITVRKPPDGGVAARRGRPGPHAVLALTVAAALIGFLAAGVLRSRDPLRRAWRAAVTVGHYRMQGETRWQSGTQRDVWQVEGVGRLDGRLAVTLTQASDAPHAKPLALSIAWPDLRLAAPFESLAAPDPHAMARALPGGGSAGPPGRGAGRARRAYGGRRMAGLPGVGLPGRRRCLSGLVAGASSLPSGQRRYGRNGHLSGPAATLAGPGHPASLSPGRKPEPAPRGRRTDRSGLVGLAVRMDN